MSWNVEAVGKAAAVRAAVAKQFAGTTCQEPEETVKNKIAEAVDAALAAFPTNVAVTVSARGSQSKADYSKPEATNTASLELKVLYGFAE